MRLWFHSVPTPMMLKRIFFCRRFLGQLAAVLLAGSLAVGQHDHLRQPAGPQVPSRPRPCRRGCPRPWRCRPDRRRTCRPSGSRPRSGPCRRWAWAAGRPGSYGRRRRWRGCRSGLSRWMADAAACWMRLESADAGAVFLVHGAADVQDQGEVDGQGTCTSAGRDELDQRVAGGGFAGHRDAAAVHHPLDVNLGLGCRCHGGAAPARRGWGIGSGKSAAVGRMGSSARAEAECGRPGREDSVFLSRRAPRRNGARGGLRGFRPNRRRTAEAALPSGANFIYDATPGRCTEENEINSGAGRGKVVGTGTTPAVPRKPLL